MKMKNMWKRFWTLDVHNHAGFTLVELIIVIAILAILSTGAIAGYSAYIKSANMTTDKALIAEIENVLTLAGYSESFNEGFSGCIILSTVGVENYNDIKDTNLDKVLIDAYGAKWYESLKLNYGEWGSSGLLENLYAEMADAVANSSYMTGNRVDALLSDVEKMTSMATNLVGVLASGDGVEASLSGMFTKDDGTCVLDDTAATYGISKGDYATWEDWAAASSENQTAYSNLLVLAAADESENLLLNGTEMSTASNMILEFSSFYAFAATNPEFSATLDTYLDNLSTVTDVSSGSDWFNGLKAEADSYGYSDSAIYTDEQKAYDEMGFLSIMAGLGNPTDEQAANIANDLSNVNLFTNGVVNSMYNDYLDAVAVLSSSSLENISIEDGQIAILVIQEGGQVTVVNSLPTA